MLLKLLELIITLLMSVLKLILNIVMLLFPTINLSQYSGGITAFLGLMNNAVNLTNFLIGPQYVFYIDIAFIIWTAKHSVLPIVCIVRKFLAKG